MEKNGHHYAFIVGSPRSGTTVIGDILDLHPRIGRWFEPYFVLDRYFRASPDDCRTASDAVDEVRRYIAGAFDYFRLRRGCDVVVDKSPRNSLKIPFLLGIFPRARFIHVLRDGRDATLSIRREWRRREEILSGNGKSILRGIRTVKNDLLDKQPLFVHKVAALSFELGGPLDLLRGGTQHRLRWNGKIGWGPRFRGWREVLEARSTLEFNALQWAKCVEAIDEGSGLFESGQFLEVRYEDFLIQPELELGKIFDFLGVPLSPDRMPPLPAIDRSNSGKWKDGFSEEEKSLIGPILSDLLVRRKYEEDDAWFKRNQ